jgi:hypothetical protein
MRKKVPLLLITLFILYTIVFIGINHWNTNRTIRAIYSLQNETTTKDALRNKYKKAYHIFDNKEELEKFISFMQIPSPENLAVIKITHKGIPFFYGAIYLDTLNSKVTFVKIKELN